MDSHIYILCEGELKHSTTYFIQTFLEFYYLCTISNPQFLLMYPEYLYINVSLDKINCTCHITYLYNTLMRAEVQGLWAEVQGLWAEVQGLFLPHSFLYHSFWCLTQNQTSWPTQSHTVLSYVT